MSLAQSHAAQRITCARRENTRRRSCVCVVETRVLDLFFSEPADVSTDDARRDRLLGSRLVQCAGAAREVNEECEGAEFGDALGRHAARLTVERLAEDDVNERNEHRGGNE